MNTQHTQTLRPLALCLALALGACAPFAMETPANMAELQESEYSNYNYRATTPEGIVFAARQVRQSDKGDTPRANLDFWSEALKLRMRTNAGYALLEEREVTAADGTPGIHLEFGRDQYQKAYHYWIELYVTDRYVHVLEAGGDKENFEASREVIEGAFASYVIRR